MSKTKASLLFLLVAIIAIQFVRPVRNKSEQVSTNNINHVFTVPDKIAGILRTSCYDCHSNNTRYPWYVEIEPAGWWLTSHINKGKSELNFDEFGNYSNRRQRSKLKSIINSIDDGVMPLSSYTLIHRDAVLSQEDKISIKSWANAMQDSLALRK